MVLLLKVMAAPLHILKLNSTWTGFLCTESKFMVYNTSQGIVPGKLNVHLVAHTHDDVGWLKTVDQYYVGSNNSIQGACVQNVLDSLVPALLADKNRKFIYVEQAFFQRWWRDQSETIQHVVKQLVSSGQLEFINGGMCMHDEAATHYVDMIDQTTLGHRFIKKEFGVVPRIGWQIDPFGHSAVQAYLLGAEVGFDSFFFGRIDYQDRAKRKNEKSLEVVWKGSKSLGSSAQIFTGVFPQNYEPPPGGFYYEVNDDSPIVQDDIDLFDYNVQERVNAFVAAAVSQANITRTNHIMWTMGTDFKYQMGASMLYRANAYWTGYFTSRPALKRYVRIMSGYYLAARQLEFFQGRSNSGPNTDKLADALAIAQHHDAVTGTEKQHVANDYAKHTGCGNPTMKFQQVVVVYNSLGWKRDDVIKIPVINENVTVHDFEGREIESQLLPPASAYVDLRNYYVRAYLGQSPTQTPKYLLAFSVSVPPLGFSTYTISSAKNPGASSTRSSVHRFQSSKKYTVEVGQGNLKLTFSTDEGKIINYVNSRSLVEEPVEQSYSYYSGYNGSDKDPQNAGAYIFRPNGTFPIKPEGQVPLTVLRGPVVEEVHQQINPWIYQTTRLHKGKEHAEVEFIVGPIPVDDGIGKEVATQIKTSMVTNKTFYTDSNGRDFIKRIRDYRTDWDLEVNQPVAGNYYPINLGIYMQDNQKEFSILVDRSFGGSSIVDGQIELMLHRRLLLDDSRGVAEALNETVCVLNKCTGLTIQGKFYFRFDPLGEGAKWRRTFGQEIYSPLLLAFAEQDGDNWMKSHVGSFSGTDSSYSLPDNVALLTLQELDDGKVILRLAHLYEIGEDKNLSVMTSVELKKLFPRKKISKVTETNLSANQERTEMEKKRLVWKVEGSSQEEHKVARGGPVDPAKLVVELAPMEIRTFVIDFNPESHRDVADA
uniref:alpha-mannosidase n=1 Tax=Fagus sylvatica TaxID=28930 RepID=A0A2N9ECH2_FAGSY